MEKLQELKELLKIGESVRLHSVLETITIKAYDKKQYQHNGELHNIDYIGEHLKGFNIIDIEVL